MSGTRSQGPTGGQGPQPTKYPKAERKDKAGEEKPAHMLFKGEKQDWAPGRERVGRWSFLKSEGAAAYGRWLSLELERRPGITCLNANDKPLCGTFFLSLTLHPVSHTTGEINHLFPQNNTNLAFRNTLPLTFRCQHRISFHDSTLLAGLRVNGLLNTIFSILSYIFEIFLKWKIKDKNKKKKDLIH